MSNSMIIFLTIWTVIGLIIYSAAFWGVKKPIKKFVLSLICGPAAWIWGIIDWCMEN